MDELEKLRAEVERLHDEEWSRRSSCEAKYRCETYRELLDFIDSLEEPKKKEDKIMERYLAKDALVKFLKRVYTEDGNQQLEAYKEIVRAEREGDTETLLESLDAVIDFCIELKKSI